MIFVKAWSLLFITILMIGCTTIKQEKANYIRGDLWKKTPVSVIVNDGYLGGYGDLRTGALTRGIIQSFRKSGLFERVDVNNAYSDYVFDIKLEEQTPSAAETVGFIASAATLFLVPATNNNTMTMRTTVRSKNKILKEYVHTIDVEERAFLLEDPTKRLYEMMDVLTSYLFRDIQLDGVIRVE